MTTLACTVVVQLSDSSALFLPLACLTENVQSDSFDAWGKLCDRSENVVNLCSCFCILWVMHWFARRGASAIGFAFSLLLVVIARPETQTYWQSFVPSVIHFIEQMVMCRWWKKSSEYSDLESALHF